MGQTGFGGNVGLTRFLFVEGQEVVIDYDAEIEAGSLYFYVFQPFDGTLGDGASHYVSRSGAGTWTWRVPETGFYTVIIRPTVGGGDSGYDMSYSAWWGARPAH